MLPTSVCAVSRRRQRECPSVCAASLRHTSFESSGQLPERRSLLVPTLSFSRLFVSLVSVALIACSRYAFCPEKSPGTSVYVLSCLWAPSVPLTFLAAAQETDAESDWPHEDSGELGGEGESEEFSVEDNPDAATHRIYHHGDKYYRAVPLTDLGALLRGIRASLPENVLSDQEWYDVTEEISTKLELLDRRMYPQTLLEAIAENEAMEHGALLTPLADEELTEEGAKAYELEK